MMKVICLLLNIWSVKGLNSIINHGLCDVYQVNLYPYLSIQECGQIRPCCTAIIPEIDLYLNKKCFNVKKKYFEKYFDKEAHINQIIREIIQHRNEFSHNNALGSYNELFEVFYAVTYAIICKLITIKYFSLQHTSPLILNYKLGQLCYKTPYFLSIRDLMKCNPIKLGNFDELIHDIRKFKQEVFPHRRTGIVKQYLRDAENANYIFRYMSKTKAINSPSTPPTFMLLCSETGVV